MKLPVFPEQYREHEPTVRAIIRRIFALKSEFDRLKGISSECISSREIEEQFFIDMNHQFRARGVPHRENYLILRLTFEMGVPDPDDLIEPGLGWTLFIAGEGNEKLSAEIRRILKEHP